MKSFFLYRTNTSKFRHCEEGVLPDEAISNIVSEIASGEYALAMTGCTVEKSCSNNVNLNHNKSAGTFILALLCFKAKRSR